MDNKSIKCPHCGRFIDDDNTSDNFIDPGIIFDPDDTEAEIFNRVKITDITGDPFNDWPLIVARFQHSLPWLVEVIRSDPIINRYLKNKIEDTPPAQGTPSQLWQDLDAVRSHLPKIVQNGQFTYGHQSRIAEALGVPNQGSYRRRIQNVARAIERTLIKTSTKNSTSSTISTAPPEDSQTTRRAA